MSEDTLFPTNDRSNSQSLAPLPANGPEQHLGDWNGAAVLSPAPEPAGPELATFFHAFRRHWLLSLGLGIVCAAVVGAAVYVLQGDRYTATYYLQVDMQERPVFGSPTNVVDRERFEIFKNTQKGKLLGRFVLLAALRKQDVARIPIIKEQQRIGDPADWLLNHLSVTFPDKAEIMAVSITRPDGTEAATLVNAVVESYWHEVVNAEQDEKKQRLNKLDNACVEKEQQIRNNRQELKSLVSYGTGSGDADMITQQQKQLLEELGVYRQQLARWQIDAGELESQLVAQQALLKNVNTVDVPGEEVDMLLANDPQARQLSYELGMKKTEQSYNDLATAPGSKNKYAERYDRELNTLQKQYDERVKTLAAKVREKKHSIIAAECIKFQTSLDVKNRQCKMVEETVKKMKDQASKFGIVSVDIEMLKAGLKQSEATYMSLDAEREKMKVELNNAPRITRLYPAETPPMPSNSIFRIIVTVFTTLLAFGCPAVIVIALDARVRRINTAEDVSRKLRVPVIGSVPLIPSRVIRHLGSPSKRYQSWHVRLTESVDGITARVLHKAEVGQCRVIMVSSAAGGEGKTTLATQLAMSLARTKRKVVLVDFDLRRPAFDGVFGMPLEPGVCEVLRKQCEVLGLARPSGTENMDVIMAGRWDRHALASLSNGCAGKMFEQLREAYEFVVLDTSPLLPVADARFVSQHVDAVVLSVLRDISQAPKIQAACDILAAFGVSSVEAVVTGGGDNQYGQHAGYESTVSA